MKHRQIFLVAGLLLWGDPTFVQAQELTNEILIENLKGNPDGFEKIEIAPKGKFTDLEIKLGESVVKTKEGFVFDGFHFTAPETAGQDLVWFFNAPKSWGHWYILPSDGTMEKPGFRSWNNADKIYDPFDRPGEPDRLRVLQTLVGSYFETGKNYLIWFRQREKSEGDDTLRVRLGFAKKGEDENWDTKTLEKTLQLKPRPVAEQVAHLQSRGGRILLDPKFLNPGTQKIE